MQEEVIAEAPAEEVIPESAAQPTETTAESEQEAKPESRRRLYAGGTRFHRAEASCQGIATDCQACRGGSRKPDAETADGTGATETRGTVRKARTFAVSGLRKLYRSGCRVEQTRNLQRSAPNRKRNSANVKHRNAQRYSKNSAAQRRNMRISRKLPLILPFDYSAHGEAIADSDMGGDVAYYLGTHRDEAHRIASLSPSNKCRNSRSSKRNFRLRRYKNERAKTHLAGEYEQAALAMGW